MTDKYGVGQDPYCYPNSSLLINLLDLKSEEELTAAEVEFTSYRLSTFIPDFDNLSFDYLCHIHYHLFQDLYSWAGQIRTVDIAKQSTHFCNVRYISKSAEKCFEVLPRNNYFREMPLPVFINNLADFFCEVNVLHPFREGNGRSLRLFCEVLALQAGYELSWHHISQEDWLLANIAGYQGDLMPLFRLFRLATKPIDI
ncbi:putative adenosine monophosphate-protein transferase Fic [Alishewanella sp. HH-ZS]|uniref:putative adenosine monophosphate-protein transferase Fic n=1 Tax=Alishewanella sp. HH-ZS TaxID=1856684 RepID=UPI0008235F83|nr:putative adenosine monophosphate-protein transferase Fic [Alishewanella sp. HH-ZS]OCW97548.1 cell filamentation protein Fic [Alishewanella sp. HH-ZS]